VRRRERRIGPRACASGFQAGGKGAYGELERRQWLEREWNPRFWQCLVIPRTEYVGNRSRNFEKLGISPSRFLKTCEKIRKLRKRGLNPGQTTGHKRYAEPFAVKQRDRTTTFTRPGRAERSQAVQGGCMKSRYFPPLYTETICAASCFQSL